MIALSRWQRTGLLFFSASATIAWFSGVGERIEAQGLGFSPAPMTTAPLDRMPRRVAAMIVRDPFAGRPNESGASQPRTTEPSAASGAASVAAARRVTVDRAGIVVPDIDPVAVAAPEAGAVAAGRPAGDEVQLVLKATITGSDSVAYVAAGSTMQLVRVGDTLGGRRVQTIDGRGLGFTDGTRLELSVLQAPPVPVRTGAPRIELTVDQLRRLVRPPRAIVAEPAAEAATPQPPTPAPTYPSPGPIPTTNADGFPVGDNPTPNASGPTPFPNPYLYDLGGR